MADSNITKRALAAALRELMEDIPFDKIKVADICEKCDMNRKSFYYHFRDKYDLVNWIYNTEFIAALGKKPIDTGWDFLQSLCVYLHENRDFYRKALKIRGKNSFSEHFRRMLLPVIVNYLRNPLSRQETLEFHVNFVADAFISAVERWIQEKDCITADEFLLLLKSCVEQTAVKVYRDMNLS